jgi:hypothetical protein
MAIVWFQGGIEDEHNGDLAGSPDLRGLLTMGGTTCDTEDAVNLADFTTIDEFDGVNYVRIDFANVADAYDAATRKMQITADNGDCGTDVAPGSGPISGMLILRHVDGTEANDRAVCWTDEGGLAGVNAANGALNVVLTDGILLTLGGAA